MRGSAIFWAAWLALASPVLAAGQILVESKPSGAAVRVDGHAVGAAPLLVEVSPGKHRVELELKGHQPMAFNVPVLDGLTSRRRVALTPIRRVGSLAVTSAPAGANVYVDGRLRGRTPLRLDGLAPGRHGVTIALSGHRRADRRVVVPHGGIATVHAGLRALPAAQPPARPVSVAATRPPQAKPAAPKPQPKAARPAPAPAAAPQAAPPKPQPQPPLPLAAVAPAAPPEPAPTQGGFERSPAEPLDPRGWIFSGLLALLALGALGYARREPAAPAPGLRPSAGAFKPQRPEPAWGALAAGPWEEAERLLAHQARQGQADAWGYYHLGVVLEAQGRLWEAEGAYRTALQLQPDHREAAYNLAGVLYGLEQPTQALIAYMRLIAVHPRDADALYNMGHIYLALDEPAQARALWLRARRVDPRAEDVRAALKACPRPRRRRRAA